MADLCCNGRHNSSSVSCNINTINYLSQHTHTHNRLTAFDPGLPGLVGTKRNTHPLTPILIIGHPLSTSSIYYAP